VQHNLGVFGGLANRVHVPQVGPDPRRFRHGNRVVYCHQRALGRQPAADIQARRVPDVVAVRLERDAQHGDPLPGQVAADSRAGQLDDPVAATQVDRLDGGQQVFQRANALFRRCAAECADILGQAAAAETEARRQEFPADPLVQADRVRELEHVRARGFAHLRHNVDERDLGR
jgi:hypothetical protein